METPSKVIQPQVRLESERPTQATRIPFGVPMLKLGVRMHIPGYHLYWANDAKGNVEQAQAGGYEFVAPHEVGEAGEGSQVRRLVGSQKDGSPLYAFLLKIKLDWHNEDKALLAETDDRFDRDIRAGALDKRAGERRYTPGISIKEI